MRRQVATATDQLCRRRALVTVVAMSRAAKSKVHEDGSAGVVVAGAKQRAEQLDSKKFVNGDFRDSHKDTRLQPRGGAGLKAKVPKRKDFGDEGDEGDAAHGAAMKELSLADFGCSHVQDRTLRRGVRGEVGTIRWCDAPPRKGKSVHRERRGARGEV